MLIPDPVTKTLTFTRVLAERDDKVFCTTCWGPMWFPASSLVHPSSLHPVWRWFQRLLTR